MCLHLCVWSVYKVKEIEKFVCVFLLCVNVLIAGFTRLIGKLLFVFKSLFYKECLVAIKHQVMTHKTVKQSTKYWKSTRVKPRVVFCSCIKYICSYVFQLFQVYFLLPLKLDRRLKKQIIYALLSIHRGSNGKVCHKKIYLKVSTVPPAARGHTVFEDW